MLIMPHDYLTAAPQETLENTALRCPAVLRGCPSTLSASPLSRPRPKQAKKRKRPKRPGEQNDTNYESVLVVAAKKNVASALKPLVSRTLVTFRRLGIF